PTRSGHSDFRRSRRAGRYSDTTRGTPGPPLPDKERPPKRRNPSRAFLTAVRTSAPHATQHRPTHTVNGRTLDPAEFAQAPSSSQRSLKVSFFGHFGSLNSGNESTLLAIVSRLRARYPKSHLRCICTEPDCVAARYGIEAVPITTRAARGVRDRNTPFARRVLMAFVVAGAEPRQYVRAF